MKNSVPSANQSLKVEEIARLVSGTVEGDQELVVKGVSAFDSAKPDEITFANTPKYLDNIHHTKACAVLVPKDAPQSDKVLVRVNDPYLALAQVSGYFHGALPPASGISPEAFVGDDFTSSESVSISPGVFVGDDVTLGKNVLLHAGVFIGNGVQIGDDTVIHPNVSILDRCRIGNRVVVHAGSVIGSDGFGFASDGNHYHKIPQIGIVRIDDDVEIGACNAIDRGTFGETWIKKGVKTDNLVHIAHNVTVGEDTVIVAQVGIAGSVKIGHHCILAGQAGVGQHLSIGDRAIVGPQAGVTKSVPAGQIVSGTPTIPHRLWLKVSNIISKLPDMKRRLRRLEKRTERLEKHRGG